MKCGQIYKLIRLIDEKTYIYWMDCSILLAAQVVRHHPKFRSNLNQYLYLYLTII